LLRPLHDDAGPRVIKALCMRFAPRLRKAVLTLHIATAVGWLGVDVVMLTLGTAGLSGSVSPAVVYPAMGLLGVVLFTPLSFLVWAVAVVNAIGTPWGLLKHWWVTTKLIVVSAMLVLVVFALYPLVADARTLGAALAQQERLNLVIAPSVSSLLLMTATILSTYKPWGRIRRWPPRRQLAPVRAPTG
jgi:hypothetical protein